MVNQPQADKNFPILWRCHILLWHVPKSCHWNPLLPTCQFAKHNQGIEAPLSYCAKRWFNRGFNQELHLCYAFIPSECIQSHEEVIANIKSLLVFINSPPELKCHVVKTYCECYLTDITIILQSIWAFAVSALSSGHKSNHLCSRIHHHCFSCCQRDPSCTNQVQWHPSGKSQSSLWEVEFDLERLDRSLE